MRYTTTSDKVTMAVSMSYTTTKHKSSMKFITVIIYIQVSEHSGQCSFSTLLTHWELRYVVFHLGTRLTDNNALSVSFLQTFHLYIHIHFMKWLCHLQNLLSALCKMIVTYQQKATTNPNHLLLILGKWVCIHWWAMPNKVILGYFEWHALQLNSLWNKMRKTLDMN